MVRTNGDPRFGYEPIYLDTNKIGICVSYCMDNDIEVTEGTDFEFHDCGGKWRETTYDQPDRYDPNNQPVFKEEFLKSVIRDLQIKNILD